MGEYGQAREYYTHALVLARQLDYRRAEAEALCGLGHVASDTAERSQARECWGKALEIYEKLGVGTDAVRAAIRQLDG